MKVSFKILLITALLYSCQSDFLEENLDNVLVSNNYYSTVEEAESAVIGLYSQLARDGLYGLYLSMCSDLGTDVAYFTQRTNTIYTYANYLITTSTGNLIATWRQAYSVIHASNLLIEKLPEKATFSQERQNELLAEARFIRALTYFVLVRIYGDIPLIEKPQNLSDNLQVSRAPVAEVYEFILEDLNFAKEHMKWLSEMPQSGGRVSKNAVLGVLTRVYSTMAGHPLQDTSKWEMAASTAKELIDTNFHDLLPNYSQIFLNLRDDVYDFTESIWEIAYTEGDLGHRIGSFNGIRSTSGPNGEPGSEVGGGSGFVKSTVNLRKKYGENGEGYDPGITDFRYHWNCIPYQLDGTGKPRLNSDGTVKLSNEFLLVSYRKEMSFGAYTANETGVNALTLRYADVLLMYAEAENELNGIQRNPLANDILKQIRQRAFRSFSDSGAVTQFEDVEIEGINYNYDYSSLSQVDFRNFLRDERARELPGEGVRRWDLLRWNLLYPFVKSLEGREPRGTAWENIQPHHVLFPIPQREIDINPLLTQNEGY
ncbi:MAG: RagB/SusD family nutrient uptake outer membrane protein [Flavobacteriaceae bacterium]|nr:RagB/SusD family nutrient uptake outer membrane protein [Flavobacteriaceae bacterium]